MADNVLAFETGLASCWSVFFVFFFPARPD